MMAEGVSGEIRLCLDVSQYMPDGYALTLTDYGVHTANAKTLTLLVVGRLTENHQGEKPPSPAAAVPPPPPSTETPPGLTVTGFAPAPDVPLDPPAVAQAGKPHVAVPAAARPADKTHVCHFDAAPWFAAATPDGIVALAERRWKGVDAGEFNVVTWCVQYDPAVAAMVTAHTNATTAELAFTVDADAAMDWIEANGDNTLLNRVIQANMANAGEPEDR